VGWLDAVRAEAHAGHSETHECPHHPGTPYVVICHCGQRLCESQRHRTGKLVALGIVGPRSWGKTLLAITALTEWRSASGDDGRGGFARPALLGLGDTETRFARLAREFYEQRSQPATTAAATTMHAPAERGLDDTQNFCWRVETDGGRSAFLTLHDAAGETWGVQPTQAQEDFDRYCALMTSVVFLVDGRGLATDLRLPSQDAWRVQAALSPAAFERQWLGALLDRLGRRARAVDCALVVSQADHIWCHEAHQDVHPQAASASGERHDEAVRTLLRRGQRADLLAFASAFRSVRAFAASSLGFSPTADTIDDERRLTRTPSPVGVVEPFEWLLQQAS
jgi:hypothetical protein